ncbi:UvrD-helicase domain-containing protein [Nocardioides sp.]|uniref:UvrD-helicase domain-containing protein n=1 Tax=Nocardioides sp. TaxID=35761 RepID=UPI003518840E
MSTAPADLVHRTRIREVTDETLFVSAGAGSGKTSALVDRVARLVLVDGIAVESIAAVTFTVKAAAELRDRLRARFEKHLADPDEQLRARAEQALEQLDLAAIGTLHGFAQRILTAHPVEAALPPSVEVLDEVASSIAFERRWARLQRDLLDDDAVAEPLILGMAAGLKLVHLRQLVRLLGQDWDQIDGRIPVRDPKAPPPPPLAMPDLGVVYTALIQVSEVLTRCSDTADKLHGHIAGVVPQLEAVRDAPDPHALVRAVSALRFTPGNAGAAKAWGCPAKQVRDEVKEVLERVAAVRGDVVAQCLQRLTEWCAGQVLAEAEERRREGRLEFHDLLVMARDLLTKQPEVRATLHETYQRLLLDEFQDTDPIQIELAVRIAGGRDADQPDWRDVVVPPGRLFVVGDAKQSIYRFRRASIATFLSAQAAIGTSVPLSVNFRSAPGVVDWVNEVFGRLIAHVPDAQPAYEPLVAHRPEPVGQTGPAVTVIGAEPVDAENATAMRVVEAGEVAAAIARLIREEWTTFDEDLKEWRPVRLADIAILLPSRASIRMLEDALDAAGVPFRAESMSMVFEAAEVRDLLAIARAIADPSDEMALLSALRSPAFGCGDDDLWRWVRAGGRIRLRSRLPEEAPADVVQGPVGVALEELQALERAARWLTPSEVLGRILEQRRFLETAADGPRSRDVWRRLRFVVDQARAWTEVSHGGLRSYLDWVAHQAREQTRVSEAILPERDVDAVRVMTIHAAKGLEFPVVVMSGMSTLPRTQSGVRLLWRADGYAVSLSKDLHDPAFEEAAALDEQMDSYERLRLLYVGATRARDHLVVSLHRPGRSLGEDPGKWTPAELLAEAGAAEVEGCLALTGTPEDRLTVPLPDAPAAPPDLAEWRAWHDRARAASQVRAALTASGLEGTEPEVPLVVEADPAGEAGLAKGARDLDLPPWSKGRYGSAVGRAVHAVLQTVDLATGAGLEAAVAAQVVAEAIPAFETVVADAVRSALDSDLVRAAATRRHWREMYVGAPKADGVLLEGIIDLVYEESPGGALVIVDYKTDVVTADTLAAKVAFYTPQLHAYRDALAAVTGRPVATHLLFLHPEGSHAAQV